MNKFIILLLAIVLSLPLKAQSNLSIGLVMPREELDGVKPDAYKLLQTKIEKALTASGVTMNGSDFVMYPIGRFVLEFFRGDDRGTGYLGMSPSQTVCVAMLVGSLVIGYVMTRWNKRRIGGI